MYRTGFLVMDRRGAEAVVSFDEDSAEKRREKKEYRHPELDEKLRTERTTREVRLMKKARKYNVSVPEILEESETQFRMRKIDGEKLRDNLKTELFEKLGEEVAALHELDIIHGDLTTSNVITGEELKIIDFGLAYQSERVEDKAVDIHLLKQVLESSHSNQSTEMWEGFMKGYQSMEASGEVLEQLEEVEQRGRYK